MSFSKKPDRGVAGLRILLVEDETMVALLLEDMLSELGHAVVGPVASLGKAMEMARDEAVDLAILDVNLDGKEAYPVAEALAARGIPFVFATGYGKGSLRAPYRDRVTLSKPFLLRDLVHAITMACPDQARRRGGSDARPAQLAP
jgi:DNA-binding response OmpR family regulator